MAKDQRVLIVGGGGRVGLQIGSELLRQSVSVAIVDVLPDELLWQRAGRTLNDARIAVGDNVGELHVSGGLDVLNVDALAEIITREQPDLVINYAIPITWDATKTLPNYHRVSAAGLGAFTPIQVLAPLCVARAMREAGLSAPLMVGNLPDITIPVLTGIAATEGLPKPVCGAGNVALNQIAFHRQIAVDLNVGMAAVELRLCSHHVHWVAPREPGYSNEAPFLADVVVNGAVHDAESEALREQMNRGVQAYYEPGAAFSSTTGILASRVAMALLDRSGVAHHLHTPAPNGLAGGYPVKIYNGEISLDLPERWDLGDAIRRMQKCHTYDGVETIKDDGSVVFTESARKVLAAELGFILPTEMSPSDIETVASAQIEVVGRALDKAKG